MKADDGIHLISSDTPSSGINVEYCQWREMGISSSFHLNISAGDKQSLRGVSLWINSHGPQLGDINCILNKQRNSEKNPRCL